MYAYPLEKRKIKKGEVYQVAKHHSKDKKNSSRMLLTTYKKRFTIKYK
jgi:hypothetical protein